jgi:hypothetical protein
MIELMAEEFKGQKIDRMGFPNLWAVHFLLHDHLDRGATANASYESRTRFSIMQLSVAVVLYPYLKSLRI